MARVTVLIPTYNRAAMIGDALEGVFAQTYTDYEVLVVDDGSTDETEEMLRPWMERLRYCKKENGGVSSARNFGLRQIETEYVAFLDSDDRWEPTFLHVVMAKLRENPELGLVTTGRVVEPRGVKRPSIRKACLEGHLYQELFFKNFVTTSAVVAQRACFDKVGGFKEEFRQAGDYDMWLRISQSYPIAFLKEYLCRHRSHAQNLTNDVVQHKLYLQKVLETNHDPGRIPDSLSRHRFSRTWTSLGRAYLGVSQKEAARECFQKAIRITPWRIRPWRYFLSVAV